MAGTLTRSWDGPVVLPFQFCCRLALVTFVILERVAAISRVREMDAFKLPSAPVSSTPPEPKSTPDTPPLAYHIPFWSERPPESFRYQLEVIFQGSIQQVIALDSKPFYLIGRLPFCDIVIDNDVCSVKSPSFSTNDLI